jgi:predicted secreted protein
MAKRFALVGAVFLAVASFASTGDIALFVNLGFSSDSKYFMFGQYGILEKNSTPWADSYIVDVSANSYAPRGTTQFSSAQPVEPGASAMGALLNSLDGGTAQKKQYRIDHLLSGRLLYVLIDGEQASDTLEFRDFPSGRIYKVALIQGTVTKDSYPRTSFNLSISIVEKDGKIRTLKAGNSSYKRPGVKAYHIKQILLAPDGNSLVFLVQKEEQDSRGSNIRYMVETVRLK